MSVPRLLSLALFLTNEGELRDEIEGLAVNFVVELGDGEVVLRFEIRVVKLDCWRTDWCQICGIGEVLER